jgi:hypothetical protein
MANRKSKAQQEQVAVAEVVEQVAVAEVADIADEKRKQQYPLADGTKLTSTPADWDVTKHRTIRRKSFATKADWFLHRAVVHARLAEVLKARATILREHGDVKYKARRRMAKLTAQLVALRAEYGVEVGDEVVQ